MAIADKYATADASIKKPIVVDDQGQIVTDEQAERRQPGDHHPRRHGHDNRHGKRKDDQPDSRYGTKQVAAVHEDPAAGGSRRQRPDDRPPRPKYTIESMLDGTCKFHSGGSKPANHTTRQCRWTKKMAETGGLPPPPPPPAGVPPDNRERRNRREDDEDGYPLQVGNYHIFLTEPETKHAKRSREEEVNAIVPPFPNTTLVRPGN